MKWLYLVSAALIFIKIFLIPHNSDFVNSLPNISFIIEESGVPNAVTGIIFQNRLYDTLFEVLVFSLAILGAKFILTKEKPLQHVRHVTDEPTKILVRLGATITALVSFELSIRGHLSPGGGFAAGVAGGTAVCLMLITSIETISIYYDRNKIALVEKISVITIILLSTLLLSGIDLPKGEMGTLFSGGLIPVLNSMVGLKVMLGSWALVRVFVYYRGLL